MASWKTVNNCAYHADTDEAELYDEYTDFQVWADNQ